MNIFDKLGLDNKPPIEPVPDIKYKLRPMVEGVMAPIKIVDARVENKDANALVNIAKRFSIVSNAREKQPARGPDADKEPVTKPAKKIVKLKTKMSAIKEGEIVDVEQEDMQEAIKEIEGMEQVAKPVEIPVEKPKKPKVYIKASEKARLATVIGDVALKKRINTNVSHINLKAPSYYMNNRAIFINAINKLFEPYKNELELSEKNISCDNIGSSVGSFDLLLHQKIVRDYLNLYTPYRGLLLYHGLGSGKTCTSIAIAEGFKSKKEVLIMTPASLHANYADQLKQCGDYMYKKNQYWEWIATNGNVEMEQTLARELSLGVENIQEKNGAWFVNVNKPSNYSMLSNKEKVSLSDQINLMISKKYHFINYNGLTASSFEMLSENYTKNIFDNKIIIIDEAHNFIGRIVNKLNKLFKNKPAGKASEEENPEHFVFEKPQREGEKETRRNNKEPSPIRYAHLSLRLYEYLLLAKNARVVLLTGTPIINYPNEIAVLFNILRGYIKSYTIPLTIETQEAVNLASLNRYLQDDYNIDYIEYGKNVLTVHRNPLGFVNVGGDDVYYGVESVDNRDVSERARMVGLMSDAQFIENIKRNLKNHNIIANLENIKVKYHKTLPDKPYDFNDWFMENITEVKHIQEFQNRIIGLTSYFRSAQEELMPSYDPNFEPILVEMSDFQFDTYEDIRSEEREAERKSRLRAAQSNVMDEASKTFKIFSRMCCNFVVPEPLERPHPVAKKKTAPAESKETSAAPVTYEDKERERKRKEQEKEAKTLEKIRKIHENMVKTQEKEDKKREKEAKAEAKEKAKEAKEKAKEDKSKAEAKEEPNAPKKKDKERGREKEEGEVSDEEEEEEEKAKPKEAVKAKPKSKTKKKVSPVEKSPEQKARKKTKKRSPSAAAAQPPGEVLNEEKLMKDSQELINILGGDGSSKEEEVDARAGVGPAGIRGDGDVEGEEDIFELTSRNPIQIADIVEEINARDMREDDMGEEQETDDALAQGGDNNYNIAVQRLFNELSERKEEYLGPANLPQCSPKFVKMIENINDPENIGLHLVYSQFRTLEGIGIFALALEAHGFARFKIKRQGLTWDTDMTDDEWAKPHYALYTGTEDKKEKDIIRAIYNGDWNDIPETISRKLRSKNHNNNVGEIIRVFMITASGSEGINLRNTRFVHIMEPYWNPVRSEQVIGRARRICSHQNLPEELRTVEVFLYLMVFSERQKANATTSLKHDDVSLFDKKMLFTTEQTLHELSSIKKKVNDQLLMGVKSTSIDCATYSKSNSANGIQCLVYDRPSSDEIVFHPNIDDDERGDTTHMQQSLTKAAVNIKGQTVTINGKQYISRIGTNEIYDYNSYMKYQETMKSAKPDLNIQLKLHGYWIDHGDGSGHLEPIRN